MRTLKPGNLRTMMTTKTPRATMMIMDIMTTLRGTQLEPIRIYSLGYQGTLLHLHSDNSSKSCSSYVSCSVLNLFSTGNHVLRCLYTSAVYLDFPLIARHSSSLDSIIQNSQR